MLLVLKGKFVLKISVFLLSLPMKYIDYTVQSYIYIFNFLHGYSFFFLFFSFLNFFFSSSLHYLQIAIENSTIITENVRERALKMIFSLLSSHTRRVTRAGVSVRGPATWSLAKSMLIHIETNPNLTSESLCLSDAQYRQLLTSVPEAADAVELIRTLSEMSTVALNQLLEREDQVGGGNDGSGDVSGNQTWWRPEVIATTAVRNFLSFF